MNEPIRFWLITSRKKISMDKKSELWDLAAIPFSRRGSYWAVSILEGRKPARDGLWLRCIRQLFGSGALLRLEGFEGSSKEVLRFEPGVLELLRADGLQVGISFDGPDCLRLRIRGGLLRLEASDAVILAMGLGNGKWRLASQSMNTLFHLVPLRGKLVVEAPWTGKETSSVSVVCQPDRLDGEMELALIESVCREPCSDREFQRWEQCVEQGERDFRGFAGKQLPVPDEWANAAHLAAYVNWSCLVRPTGRLQREAMYMSKNWMTAVWSWDHAVNALALARGLPDMAWDQFMVMFDLQDEGGCLPDAVSDRDLYVCHVKPPIHGWILERMMQEAPEGFYDGKRLREAYRVLAAQTGFWLEQRDPFGTGFPVYWHGNDSGWDNTTAMLTQSPIVGTDLLAYLIRQLEVLAGLARDLGLSQEAEKWQGERDRLLRGFQQTFWVDGRFAPAGTGVPGSVAPAAGADSLLPYMSVLLGTRLPEEILRPLVDGLMQPGRFLTDWGLASESVASPHYESDGYWRGPIWAPAMLIVVEGLDAAGRVDLADDLAARFCRACARHGFAENYDAISGRGLRDLGYTWTASTFFVLANRLCRKSG